MVSLHLTTGSQLYISKDAVFYYYYFLEKSNSVIQLAGLNVDDLVDIEQGIRIETDVNSVIILFFLLKYQVN